MIWILLTAVALWLFVGSFLAWHKRDPSKSWWWHVKTALTDPFWICSLVFFGFVTLVSVLLDIKLINKEKPKWHR